MRIRVLSKVVCASLALLFIAPAGASAAPWPPAPHPGTATRTPVGGPAKTAFALYLPTLPISLDNASPETDYYENNYLRPDGEGGKFAWAGGFLRDRPAPQAPVQGPDWQVRNLEKEIQSARAAGLTGFALNMFSFSPHGGDKLWRNQELLMRAAENSGSFSITLVPDMTAAGRSMSVEALADATAALAVSPAATRLDDGRVLVMPFQAESRSPGWWADYLRVMRERHGVPVALVPLFVSEASALIPSYAPVSVAASHWGARNPAHNDPRIEHATAPRQLASLARSYGLEWVQPVSFQDARPTQQVFDEAGNTENLRTTWELARSTGAVSALLLTWNDYSEGTHIAPSRKHGNALLQLTRYYGDEFRTGHRPPLDGDELFLSHRTQFVDDAPSYGHAVMRNRGGTPPRDTVEALVHLTAPATVTVRGSGRVARCELPAGEGVCTMPLTTGSISAQIERGGHVSTSVSSPHQVTQRPYVQDLEYVVVSSRG